MLNKLMCFIGKHKKDDDWILMWSSMKFYCKCECCGKDIIDRGQV